MIPVPRAWRRRRSIVLLALAVLLVHAGLGSWVADAAIELGAGAASAGPQRLKAVFVADLRPQAPVAPPPAAAPPRPRAVARAAPPATPASAPEPAPAAPEADVEPLPAAADAVAAVAEPSPPAASEPAMPAPPVAAAASDARAFEWPRSTRLSYRLSGHYRGPVEGQASVEWLRQDQRYQVHLEVSVGPSFAPLVSRRMSSDGLLGAQGLVPRHYDEETKVALRSPRRVAVLFDESRVRLATGAEQALPAGVQDTASQFVQLTWLFNTQPGRLQAGQSVEFMLALPRRVDLWVYDVLGTETLHTPVGEIEAFHLRPRRPARPDGELSAEVWIAPTLQYLPVRIVIRQDADTHVDLLLERLPQQEAAAAVGR